jgi:hypothetical protein
MAGRQPPVNQAYAGKRPRAAHTQCKPRVRTWKDVQIPEGPPPGFPPRMKWAWHKRASKAAKLKANNPAQYAPKLPTPVCPCGAAYDIVVHAEYYTLACSKE